MLDGIELVTDASMFDVPSDDEQARYKTIRDKEPEE